MFSHKQETVLKFWGFSWIAYSVSLLCLVFFLNTQSILFLELRKVVDMFNLLLLLFGSYAFIHIKIPAYWYRFSLYLVLLAIICMIYGFDLYAFYLPISVYQIIITAFTIYIIAKYWNISSAEKMISLLVFLIWGIGKTVLSFAAIFSHLSDNTYVIEIILSNVVNFCILTIYIEYMSSKSGLADALYRTVVDNAKDAIFYYRLKPYEAFEYVSPSIDTLTGYHPSDFYNNPRLYVQLVTDHYFDIVDDAFHGNIAHTDKHIIPIIRKNGETFWGEINFTVLKDEKEQPFAVEGILRDISMLKYAELTQINEKENRNKQLSYISHELRTPVTLIAGYLTAIEDGTLSSENERNEAMKIITSKTMLLKNLIDDLDQLSRMETHQFTFDFITYTITDIMDYLIRENLADIEASGFEVELIADSNKLQKHWIIADQNRINQVFSNILVNAIKYSADHKKIVISFDLDPSEENFVVSVRDYGIGIPPDKLPYIFDRFFRDSNASAIKGRGLGLTICKEIIIAHGGKITAVSNPDFAGSKFIFTIPLYNEAGNMPPPS
ncbi:sensor histidine kinase [Sinanaerobacter chloroacetimidivorans]|nr:PAS domain-containing sensor histidine kinase [Sinanaerobacter chloroacetimidivorans]